MDVFRALLPLLIGASLATTPARAADPDLGEPILEKRGWLKEYSSEIEAAWAGDCDPLLAAARPNDPLEKDANGSIPRAEKVRGLMAMDMWDRGLCVLKSPERGSSIEAILAADEWVPRYDLYLYMPVRWRPLYLDQGWRAWHGYGRPRDEEAARSFIAEGLVLDHWRWDDPGFGTTTDLGRPLPPYATQVADWIRERMGDDDSRIAFAVSLIKDGVEAPRGVHIEPAPGIGGWILSPMDHSAEAMYQFALLLKDGFLGEKRRFTWSSEMRSAARCGHVKAALEIVEFEMTRGDSETPRAPYSAVAWLWHLFDKGYDTLPRIRQISDRYRISGTRESYLGLLSIIEETPPDCA